MKKLRKILLWIVLLFFGSTILIVLLYRWVPVYYTPLMGIRSIQQKWDGREVKCSHHWVPLDSINSALAVAVIASEDQNFELHNGFDFEAIEKAQTWFGMKEAAEAGGSAKDSKVDDGSIYVKTDNKVLQKVMLSDILFVVGMKDYVMIHTKASDAPLMTHITMKGCFFSKGFQDQMSSRLF